MREIKFRVWNNNTNKYEYTKLDYYFVIDQRIKEYEYEQYTGLKDKNGKEIYEGDIVRTTDRVTVKGLMFPIGVVEFKQQAFWICNVPSEQPDFTHNETLLRYWETDLEVIGNIHENPELLEGEK